jgi:hypothetical protein
MRIEEKQYLSTIYAIKNLFQLLPNITITEEYPESDIELPTVSIVENPIYISPLELGNRVGKRKRDWLIEVFGASRAQRDYMAATIAEGIENGIGVFDYDYGFPPSATPPQIGTLIIVPNTLVLTPIVVFPDLVEKLYWRSSIKYLTEYESII